MGPFRWAAGGIVAGGLALVLVGLGRGQQQSMLQYGFEGRDPVWVQGAADAAFKETAHALTDEYAHSGQRSEHLQLQAEAGHFIHYAYDLGKAPVSDDLNVSVWLRANRPDLRLLCRVVLPHERDPNAPGQPLTTVLRGDDYKLVGRWQQLTLPQPVKRLREQQQLLQADLKRDVDVSDAYVDRIVLNVYGGPGLTDVWVDDLEAGPVTEPAATTTANRGVPGRPAVRRRAAEVQLSGNKLLVAGQGFFLRGIRHTGTPLKTLRDAGFNTVWLDESAPPGLVEDAVNLGFWIVPTVTPPGVPGEDRRLVQGQLTSRDAFAKTVARFLDEEGVLCWNLGSNLDAENFGLVSRAAEAFRQADPMRPLAVDVWDGLQRYSRGVDPVLLGIHRWPLMTGLEMIGYRDWLIQRRRLAAPETFCWTWVQTHLPDWFTTVAYERPGAAGFQEPIGPQAEQVRLLTYTAAAAGFRGLGFWSDRYLADSHAGRDRLLALAQLNLELKMLEPLLVAAKREPEWIDTTVPSVKAAVLRTDRAVLVLPIWMGEGSQYVTGQGGFPELTLVVPQVPASAQAWEVTPARVRSYACERVLGGTRIHVRDFNLTTAIVLTSDLGPTGLVVRFQDQQRRMGKVAAQWAHDQAVEEMNKVVKVNDALESLGRPLPDGKAILGRARGFLDRCAKHRMNGEHAAAYEDAQLALRALRIMMRAHWDRAVLELDTPVASPYAVSFFTLPRHWQLVDEILRLRAGANVLPDGGFEAAPDRGAGGWTVQEVPTLDPVTPKASRVAQAPKEGKQCLLLQVSAKDPLVPPAALERTFLALHSPPVRLPPGTLVRISAWVKAGVTVSPDGALLYDSAGGEPLALRVNVTPVWKRYYLYRRVPASGTIRVTLALTGLGSVFFDDVRVEPLVPRDAPPTLLAPRPPAPAGPPTAAALGPGGRVP